MCLNIHFDKSPVISTRKLKCVCVCCLCCSGTSQGGAPRAYLWVKGFLYYIYFWPGPPSTFWPRHALSSHIPDAKSLSTADHFVPVQIKNIPQTNVQPHPETPSPGFCVQSMPRKGHSSQPPGNQKPSTTALVTYPVGLFYVERRKELRKKFQSSMNHMLTFFIVYLSRLKQHENKAGCLQLV